MGRDPAWTELLHTLLAQVTSLTANGALHWEKQAHSSHRYAEWNDILLILGPDAPLEDRKTPRYLHVTPLFSPGWLEIRSDDADLRNSLMALVYAVEAATEYQPLTDPFALTDDLLRQLKE